MSTEIKLGDIQPFARYYIIEIKGKTYVVKEDCYSKDIIGEIVDIINSRDIEKYEEYRNQGYWGVKLKNSERMLVLKSLNLEEKRKLYNNLHQEI